MEQTVREQPLSVWWRHGLILVLIFGFAILSVVTVLTYSNAPPIPQKVVDESGDVLFTRENIEAGQGVFLKYDLMELGTLWGHGAYLGPDFTAEYLHQEAGITQDAIAARQFSTSYTQLTPDQKSSAAQAVKQELKENRYDAARREPTT